MAEQKKLDFEQSMAKLEKAAANLTKEDITLDDAIKNYEEGIKYYNQCNEILANAKQKIETYNNKLK
ncbi:MAG: exodeoxyribonuclease VII small subunit [Eubacteriaceae bacterium]|nr:exodeoxyribonuclease VII small subunit [Eubacteriaceae bacterium]